MHCTASTEWVMFVWTLQFLYVYLWQFWFKCQDFRLREWYSCRGLALHVIANSGVSTLGTTIAKIKVLCTPRSSQLRWTHARQFMDSTFYVPEMLPAPSQTSTLSLLYAERPDCLPYCIVSTGRDYLGGGDCYTMSIIQNHVHQITNRIHITTVSISIVRGMLTMCSAPRAMRRVSEVWLSSAGIPVSQWVESVCCCALFS